MQLKTYQIKCLDIIRQYLIKLAEKRQKRKEAVSMDKDFDFNFPEKAWQEFFAKETRYVSKRNGIGEYLPNFCIKVPTGGGKTLLATHAIDLIQRHYLRQQTGFILWVVPTTQIYEQTLQALKKRVHPYRQVLDLCSGGKTIVVEKSDTFHTLDVAEGLVVMLLMLPSANRQNKETLKIFQDTGGFMSFFPDDDNLPEHAKLLEKVPNLDCFNSLHHLYGRQIKTSLGNTLRLLKPIIIIDEGQKAYSEGAIQTIAGFNPRMVVELSATPPYKANILVDIKGKEVWQEQMIKLDINVTNKANDKWEHTLLTSVAKRMELENEAIAYEMNKGIYIRPINLIQAERTGKDQRDGKFIHAEDIKEYLIQYANVSPEEIAIKSSSQNDIENIDLYDKNCPIRYIITKQALQEGWDCSFAYILTILTNPSSKNALTQLVGRVLRQPYAQKTGIKALDESYVFCFKQNANKLIQNIKNGLESEGLTDLYGKVRVSESGNTPDEVRAEVRQEFKPYEGKIYLPRFVVKEENNWREMNYEMDLHSRIDWNNLDITEELQKIKLSENSNDDGLSIVGYTENTYNFTVKNPLYTKSKTLGIDLVLITKNLTKIVPNAWTAYKIAQDTIAYFQEKHKNNLELIEYNTVFIIEELLKILEKKKQMFSRHIFLDLISQGIIQFRLQKEVGFPIPRSIRLKSDYKNFQVNKSLFDPIDKEEFNGLEDAVALCLDEQKQLLAWHRNAVGKEHYYIKGYKDDYIYPDFVAIEIGMPSQVYILESKGKHLKENEDTQYKKSIFDICNELAKEIDWESLKEEFPTRKIEFYVINEDDYKNKINGLLGGKD